MPARASHLPTHIERTALQRLRAGSELTLKELEPTSHAILLKMMAKGWVERGIAIGTYRITRTGEEAVRTPLP